MEKEIMLMAFANQKGGVGKSTFTILAASYLQFVCGLEVAVMDCDFPQWNVVDARERELKMLDDNQYLKEKMVRQFQATKKSLYPILKCKASTALSDLDAFIVNDKRNFDVILFDLPGTINSEGVLSTIAALDHIFVPMVADTMIMESTISFATVVNEMLVNKGGNLKGVHLFWSMIDKRERTPLYDQYEKVLEMYSLHVLSTHIPFRRRFNKGMSVRDASVLRSTLYPADRTNLRDCNLDELMNEILSILKLIEHGKKQ